MFACRAPIVGFWLVPPVSHVQRVAPRARRDRMEDDATVAIVLGRFDPFTRSGVTAALAEDRRLRVVAVDVDPADFEHSVHGDPQVLVVSEPDAIAALENAGTQHDVGIVVLAHDPSPLYGRVLLALGASCVARGAPIDAILSACRLVGQGGRAFVPSTGRQPEQIPTKAPPLLTRQEKRVLKAISSGLLYAAIAAELSIEAETARKHTANICRKVGARRQELVGILSAEPRFG
jgi:DNA-binding NarL/FixJ family response regulator